MPKFGSLRGKMLALILTPVAAAIILVTFFAISRASSDQKAAAFAELAAAHGGRGAEGRRDHRRRARHRSFRGRRPGLVDQSRRHRRRADKTLLARQQQVDHGRVLEHAAQQLRRQGRDQRRRAGHRQGRQLRAERHADRRRARSPRPPRPTTPRAPPASSKKPMSGVQEPAAYEGTMYVTYQVPVERGGKVVGFAGTANTLAGLDGQISKTKLLDSGYAFAVSAKGVFVASPDKKNNGKLSLASLAKEKNNPELTQVAESIAAGKRRPDRDRRPVHRQGHRPHVVGHRQRGLELPDRRPGVRGARARQRDAHHAADHRPDHAGARQRRDPAGGEQAHQADQHRHRGRRAAGRGRGRRQGRHQLQ